MAKKDLKNNDAHFPSAQQGGLVEQSKKQLVEALALSAISDSPEPWPRAQSATRPSPSLERNYRLARALATSAIGASLEP